MINKKAKKIKWYNIIISIYYIITFYKYFITSNPNIIILTFDVLLDLIIGVIFYEILTDINKLIKNKSK